MRIVLVHPAGSNWIAGKKDITATANRMAPIGLISIAAFLEREGHEVSVHDCMGPKASPTLKQNVKRILDQQPELVGFSTTTSGFLDGYDMAAMIKASRPGIKTIFGGVHVSSMGAGLLADFEHIDFLGVGEGEGTMIELAEGGDLDTINGLVWRNGHKTVTNPAREYLSHLDELPFPAYEKLDGFPAEYNLPLFSYIRAPGATMITSRGCPYQCSFCDRSVFQRKYRFNSAEYIYAHMNYLRRRFNVRHITIYDDLFTTHRRRILALCEMLIEKPLGMNFNCIVRVGHADDELLRMLKQAGFLQLSLGIETGDADLIDTHKPGVDLEEVRDTVRRIQKHGLRAKGLFIMGLPGETETSIRKTSDFVMSLGLDDMNMSKFSPFYGAPVWSTLADHGNFENDWRQMNCLNFVFLPNGIASRKKMDQLYNEHVKRFYSDSDWRRKFRQRIWEHRRSLWYLIKHLPSFLAAKRSFEPERKKI